MTQVLLSYKLKVRVRYCGPKDCVRVRSTHCYHWRPPSESRRNL